MNKKLMAAVTIAAVISLALSTAAVVICSDAFASHGKITAIDSSSPSHMSTTCDETSVPDADAETSSAESAGLYGTDMYLLKYDAGMLEIINASGKLLWSAPYDAALTDAEEAELLSGGIIFTDRDALRSALEDLLT